MKIFIILKPYRLLILLAGMAAFFISSCEDIVEPSVKNKQVQLESPFNKFQSTSSTISFWWDEVEHATTYHLQVVKPDFTRPESLVLDTVITKNKFLDTLAPGNYQWRVMAENSSSQTAYSAVRSFEVAKAVGWQPSVEFNESAMIAVATQYTQKCKSAQAYKTDFAVIGYPVSLQGNAGGSASVLNRRSTAIHTVVNESQPGGIKALF
ncbi:hypothetical protein [Mucilaginibacter sp. L3T2-6]|uniref:hypothetical protein n=1 Tax=Mucilaginibacter sp. L3T2-6 TaxID=3062491 RepID=UPI0026743C80|nr:hypothetical protein [Mucilaginibacter sp. L3T2-6]MDO3645226.1 hypothetical protein [Mucilaginibacter sp. L3T2-6]MDV6217678.1 hypothetical protein [Mucilaginibacter sp. L3T2-6]